MEDLCSSIEDDEVAAIARFVSEKLSLRTVEALLGSADAERAFRRALSPAIRLRLYEALDAFVRGASAHPTRMAVRDEATKVTEPPRVATQMAAWARAHGIEDRLDRPASAVLAFVESGAHLAKHPFDAAATVHDVIHRRRLPTSGASASTLTEAARAYLLHEAIRVAEDGARRARLAVEPESLVLRRIAATLRETYERIGRTASLEEPIVERLRRIELDAETASLVGRFAPPSRAESKSEVVARVALDARPTEPRCDCARGKSGTPCVHALRVVGAALDVLHDRTHPLADAARSLLDTPTWKSLGDALDRALEKPEAPPERRLAFRVDPGDRVNPITPIIRRRHRDGGWSTGTVVAFDKAASEATELDGDEVALVALGIAAAAEPTQGRFRSALLHGLVGGGQVVDPDDPRRSVQVVVRPIAIAIELDGDAAKLLFRSGPLALDAGEIARGGTLLRWSPETRVYELSDVDPRLVPLAEASAKLDVAMPRDAAEALVDRLLSLQPAIPVLLPEALAGRRVEADLRPVARLEPLASGGLRVRLVARPILEGPSYPAGDGPPLLVGLAQGERVHALRDLHAEVDAAHRMALRLELDAGHEEGPLVSRFEAPDDALALLERISALGEALRIEWPRGVSPYRLVRAKTASPNVRVRTAARWLGVDGELDTDAGKVGLTTLLRAVREGKRYVTVSDGAFLRIEDALRERLLASADALFDGEDGLALAHANAAVLDALADPDQLVADEPLRSMRARVEAARALTPAVPEGLDQILRTYQVDGFRWMSRLSAMGFGCLLADEMGLGKTLQSLALLSLRGGEGPALVVTPTSVADGWAAEARRFAPSLSARVHLGPRRGASLDKLGPRDVLVTSYDVLARDVDAIGAVRFATAIFDEAHMLKNARTKRSEAARAVVAAARIGLTGTPIENHLGDLFGIFDVVSPGLLGSWAHFRDRYATPIERHGDSERRAALRTLVAPYVLRRTKAEVAIELPERIEVEQSVELAPEEALLYEAARRDAIADLAREEGSLARRRFAVLAAITRLRQLACHPRLLDPTSTVPSSKLGAFLELAHDLVREGHRTLVFSQFTRHLDLVREALDGAGYESLRLDGSTPARDRARLVETFQRGATPFFLISLKAGGTGLNLTAADYVVHLDPWWNPAVEDQASDRAHRLGQTQPVTIVRLVTNDTIERAVLRLHAEKRSLADALLAESSKIGKTDLDELVSLITS